MNHETADQGLLSLPGSRTMDGALEKTANNSNNFSKICFVNQQNYTNQFNFTQE